MYFTSNFQIAKYAYVYTENKLICTSIRSSKAGGIVLTVLAVAINNTWKNNGEMKEIS